MAAKSYPTPDEACIDHIDSLIQHKCLLSNQVSFCSYLFFPATKGYLKAMGKMQLNGKLISTASPISARTAFRCRCTLFSHWNVR